MKSKLAIAITLWGWLLFVVWLSYDYAEYQDRWIIHIFQRAYSYEVHAFHILIFLIPFIYTFLGYLVNEREKLLEIIRESEEKYRALALVDELTGLYNRRGFLIMVKHFLKIVKRQKKGVFLLYADVDELKRINDTWGHTEGDAALIETAKILKNNYRESDIIARISGDEFVIIPVGTGQDCIDIVVNRLKEALDIYNAQSNCGYKLSLSVGIAFYDPEHPCTIEKLLAQADKSMYEHKKSKKPIEISPLC
ncbi:MAG: GGDEF domain-containing protein [Thermodesulfovibrionales bacterium]|nr:GGDEF domain-containing protein [Thermodesulfovibrionales bacterium]